MLKNKPIVCLTAAFFLSIILTTFIQLPSPKGASLSGTWDNDIYIVPSGTDGIIGNNRPLSTLSISYGTGGISYSSESVFYRDKFYSQEFGVEYRLGIVDLSSTAHFNPDQTRLEYWLNDGSFTLAGARFDSTFLLEYIEDRDEFGAGLEVGVSGNLTEGVSADFVSRFGMEENPVEMLGITPGSGYTIVTKHGEEEDVYGPSQLQYVDSELQLTGMVFDCVEYDVTTEFSEANGFEETEFEFSIGGEENLIGFDVDLKFTSQTKSVELHPSITTKWGCFDVYTELSTSNVDNILGNNSTNASTLNGLEIEGFGISDVSLGHVTFSSLTALDGNLYRPVNTYIMDLRADDYLIDPHSDYEGLYVETDYDQVFSLYKSGEDLNLTFGGDFYFDMSNDETETNSIFDTALITANGEYKLSNQFSLGAGFSIKPDDFERVRVSFDYSF